MMQIPPIGQIETTCVVTRVPHGADVVISIRELKGGDWTDEECWLVAFAHLVAMVRDEGADPAALAAAVPPSLK